MACHQPGMTVTERTSGDAGRQVEVAFAGQVPHFTAVPFGEDDGLLAVIFGEHAASGLDELRLLLFAASGWV